MISQNPILHHFLFFNSQLIKKYFFVKVFQLEKINAKLLLKILNISRIKYIGVIKDKFYIIFFLLKYKL